MRKIKAEIVEVIRVIGTAGKGTKEDPVRTEVQYWEKSGKYIGTMNQMESRRFKDSL